MKKNKRQAATNVKNGRKILKAKTVYNELRNMEEIADDRKPFAGYLATKEIQVRKCVYISRDVQQKIARIVGVLTDGNTTIGGYIDNVIKEHLNLYRDEINALYSKRQSNLI